MYVTPSKARGAGLLAGMVLSLGTMFRPLRFAQGDTLAHLRPLIPDSCSRLLTRVSRLASHFKNNKSLYVGSGHSSAAMCVSSASTTSRSSAITGLSSRLI